MASLIRGRLPSPIEPREVRSLGCEPALKAVIRRAIGSRSFRYRDAYELRTALTAPSEAGDGPPTRIQSLEGKIVVFTGRLWTRREDAIRLVLRCGGRVGREVSSKTDVVVRGAISPIYVAGDKGLKLIEAEALRERGRKITLIDERQFRRLVGQRQ
jgi:BRCT domain type II-containing protein